MMMTMTIDERSPSGRAAGLRPQPPAASSQSSIPSAWFEAREVRDRPWVWQVWDIQHPAECNHFPILTVDSNGAAEDFHEEIARTCSEALNRRFVTAQAMSAEGQDPQGLGAKPASAVATPCAQTTTGAA